MSRQLDTAYSVCRGVARAQAKNFYYAFLALPKAKRNALCAVYAFMRHADDLSDDPGLTLAQRRQHLVRWADALRETVNGRPSDDPVILAVADTQQRYQVPVELFERLVQGTAMDLHFEELGGRGAAQSAPMVPYRTFDDLYQYCYYVASVVGLVCIRIFGYKDPAAEQLAERTGIAFQLTNIIRDVKEDALMGRVYLPEEDLARFGRTPTELSAAHMNNGFNAQAFRPLLEFEAQRAREFYQAAEKLLPMVNEDSQPCLWALVEIYRRTLDKIAARQFDVFQQRVRLTVPEKLNVLGQGLLKLVL